MANANSNININVKAKGAQRSAKDVNAVTDALGKLGTQSGKATTSTDGLSRSQTRLGQASAASGRQFSSQAAGLGGLVGAYAGAAATIFALQQAYSALNKAAQVENIVRGTQTLAAEIGESGNKIIKSIQEITDSQLTLGEAAEKANLALSTGFSTKQIEGLAFVANQASRALGRNLSDAFERVVRGSAKLEPELLDELGIFTRLDPAVRKYAKEINKSVNELTEFERRQAFVNAVIEEGTRKFSAIDTTAPSAQKSLEKLSTALLNIGTQVGGLLANTLAPLADFFSKDITGALSIFGIVAAQVTRVGFRELSGAAQGVTARLNSFKASLLESGSQSDAARFTLSALNKTLMDQESIIAKGTKKQKEAAASIFAIGKQGKLSASDLEDFSRVTKEQIKLQKESQAFAANEIKALQAKGVTTTAAKNKLADYNAAIVASTAAQANLNRSLSLSETALATVSSSVRRTSTSITILTGAVKVATTTISIFSRVLSGIFIFTALLPVIESLIGLFPKLEEKIVNIKNAFLDARDAQKAYETGIRSLANAADIGSISKEYETLGRSARDAAATQEQVLGFLTKIGKVEFPAISSLIAGLKGVSVQAVNASNEIFALQSGLGVLVGIGSLIAFSVQAPVAGVTLAIGTFAVAIDTLLGIFTSYTPKIAGFFESLLSKLGFGSTAINSTYNQLVAVYSKIEQLENDLADAKTLDEYLEISQFIDSLEAAIPLIADGSIAIRQFAAELSKATGLNIEDISRNIVESSEGILSINNVTVGLRNAEGQIERTKGAAKDLIETSIGFSTVFLNANSNLTDFNVSSQELIKNIESLASAEVNLRDRLKGVSSELVTIANKEQEAIRARDAFINKIAGTDYTTADAQRLVNLEAIANSLSTQRLQLEEARSQIEAQLKLDEARLSVLKSAGEELNKQEKTYEKILQSVAAEIKAFEDVKIQGVFDVDSLTSAETSFGVAANKIKNLSSTLSRDLNNVYSDFERVFGPESVFNLEEPFDKTNESITEFLARMQGAINITPELAIELRKGEQASNQLDASAKAVLGTFILQIKALEALKQEVARTVRDIKLDELRTAINAEISIIQQARNNRQTTASLAKEERDLSLQILDANLRTTEEKSNQLINTLNTNRELLNIQESILASQLEISKAKIEASKIELDNAKSLLELGNKGLQNSKIDKDLKEFFDIVNDVVGAGIDVAAAEKESEKVAIEIANLDKLAALDKQRFAIEREVIAERSAQAELQNKMELARIKIDSDSRVAALEERKIQVEEERRILELRDELQKAEKAAADEDKKLQLEILNKRVEEANKLITGMRDFVSAYGIENDDFLDRYSAEQTRLITQLAGLINSIGTIGNLGAGQVSVVPQGTNTLNPRPVGPDDGFRGSNGTVINNFQNATIEGLTTSSSDSLVDGILKTIRKRESGGNYSAINPKPGQTASGAYGFINSTWQALTQRQGIGTEYKSARYAPAPIQDAIASAYVEDILRRGGGRIESVPTEWYTGNLQGTMSAEALRVNDGLTSAQYNARWMRDFEEINGNLVVTTSNLQVVSDSLAQNAEIQRDTQAALNDLENDRLNTTQESLDRQIELEKQRGSAAMSAAEAAAAGQSAQIQNESRLLDKREEANAAQRQADQANNKNRERAVQLEEKLARVRLAQATFEGLSRFGNLLQRVTVGRAEERQARAQEAYNESLAVHEEKLQRVKDARERESEAVTASMDILRDRRELERSMLDSIAAGIEGYADYFKLQKEYLDNIDETSNSTESLKLVQQDRLLAEQDAYLAQISLELSTTALSEANSKLERAQNSVINKLGTFISKLGDAGQKLVSFTTFVQGLAAAASQGVTSGGILGSIGQLFGFDFSNIFKSILAPLDLLGSTLMGTVKSSAAAVSSVAEGAAQAQGALGGVGKTLKGIGSVIGSAFIGAGIASTFKEADPMTATITGAIGGALGGWVGVSIAAAISSTSFGAAFGSFLGPIGAALGGLLGGLVAKLFTKTKWSGAVLDIASGQITASGAQGGALTAVTEYANSLNTLLEDIIGTENRARYLQAVFASKGSSIKAQFLQTEVNGQAIRRNVNLSDAESVSKTTFELLLKGFTDAAYNVRLAISRLDFSEDIEKNLEKISFAASFSDIINNIEDQITSSYITLDEQVNRIAASTAANINQITNGLVADFQDLITRTIDVFGENSSQLAQLESYGSRVLLSYAGLAVSAQGVVSLIERESEDMNNLALVFASIRGETRGFRDALIQLGTSASEADRIIETGIALKIQKVAKDFEEAIDKAVNLSKNINNEVYDSLEEIFKAQRALVQDAQLVQSTVTSTFGIVTKTEELIYRQRMRLISEASDEQLKAIRALTSVTSEYSDAVTQATTQAEIASRTLLGLFNTSEIQKSARRSEARLSFNFASVGLASGGVVPGTSSQQNKDSVPAMLMPGEFVINKKASEKIGYDTLYSLNSGDFKQMAVGGAVETGLSGGALTTTPTPSNIRPSLAAYEFDGTAAFISFAEAANILTDANEELYNQYLNIFRSINSNLVPALEFAQDKLAEGNILLARAAFEYSTGVRDSVSVTDALNKIIAETRTQEVLRQAGLVASIDEIGNFVEASDSFFLSLQSPKDFLVEQSGLYKELYTATNELNKLLAQGSITTDQYNSSIDALNNAYTASIELVREYNEFFIDLNDSLDDTGALSNVRALVDTYVNSIDRISYAVEDGVIATEDAYKKEIQVNTLYNQRRLALVQDSTEEQLKVLRDANTTAEDYGGGIGTIVDFTYAAGAAAELLTRQLQAASEGFASFETSLVDFYNSSLQSSTGFGSRLTRSIESIFLEAGIVFEDSLSEFFGSVGDFAVKAQQGLVGLGNLETALGQLNYQLTVSESINIETYKTGVSILQNSFLDFVTTFQEMREELDSAKDSMEAFRSSLNDSFNSAVRDVTRLLEGMVSTYRTNFESLKNLFNSAVSDQANAEEELYNTLFDAQKAFEAAGGNLSQHVNRINDIVQGLDPQYTGYAGLDQYLTDLKLDIESGTAAIGSIDTTTPISELRGRLEEQLQRLSELQALPDSADKFVKISRALSTITDLETQINGTTSTTDSLKDAALALVDVEKELNLNNTTEGLRNVDLTLTEIQEDLLKRAVDAREAYNNANSVLDGYNAALEDNTVYINGLADATLNANQKIELFTNKLSSVSDEFTNVQSAIDSVTAENLSEALSNIVFSQDAYNIAVEPFSDSAQVLEQLNTAIADYKNILEAKTAYEELYGAIDTTSSTLPIDEFQELNTELQFLENNLTSVLQVMDPSAVGIDNLETVFKTFVTDAIALLETPIQLDIVEPSLSTDLQQYTLNTTSTEANQVAFGTSATNSILQAILTDGLGVRSPGYLYYNNLYLEDIRKILSELLVVSGGVVPALNDISAPIASAYSDTTTTTSTVYAGPNISNLSGLTGQLFSVTEPIAKPADYFYIVVPQIIRFDQLIDIVKAELTIYDFVTIVKVSHTIDTWIDIVKRTTNFDEWLDIVKRNTTFNEWLNIVKIDTKFTDWVTIIKQDHDYRTWFNQPTPLDTNYLKWFIPKPENTSWGMWFSAPTLTETGFADWFVWPPTTKWETSAYDWFDILRKEIRYIDFFDVTKKIDINTLVASTPVTAEAFFNISTMTTTFDDWFYISPKAGIGFYDFFTGLVAVETKSSDWFILDSPIDLVPSDLYTVSSPIELSAYSLFKPKVENIEASSLYAIQSPLLLNPNEVLAINQLAKLPLSYLDIFELGTTKLEITDMFENYSVNGGFDFVRARIDSSDIFDIEAFRQSGFESKLKIDPSDLFTEVDNNWWVPEQTVGITPDTFFKPLTGVAPYDFFFVEPTLLNTNFYDWFDAADKIDISNVFELFQPIPLDLRNAFDLSNTREPLAPSQVFTLSPNPTVVQASQVFSIGAKYRLQGNEILEFIPYEILASEFIDFSYLRSNPYQVTAIDLFTLIGTVPVNLLNHIEIVGKATFAANDVINVAKSTFYGQDLISIQPVNLTSDSLFTVNTPTALPGASFFSISAPTALPAAAYIGVDENKKLEYRFDQILDIIGDPVVIGLTEVFENFDYRNGFAWTKYALAVEDVVDLTVLTTSGLVDKPILSVSDLIGNYAFGDLKLENKIDIDYDSLFNPIVQKNSDFYSWFIKDKLSTTFADWFYMNEATKLDLNDLVNNTVPLDYREVFDWSNTTKIKPAEWDQVFSFDATKKITVRVYDIMIIEPATYSADTLIDFDKSTIDVSELITIGRKMNRTAGSLIDITQPLMISAANLLEIVSPLLVDLNEGVRFEKAVVDGSEIFSPVASELSGINFFNPTQFSITGAAFFTPIATAIDANDLFSISKKVPIDVTATFESDFMKMVDAINAFKDEAVPLLKTMDANLTNQPTNNATALYDQIWDYYQNTFLKSYYDQWTPKIAKLADIAQSVATSVELQKEIRNTLNAVWNWMQTFLQPKINIIVALLESIDSKLTDISDLLKSIDASLNVIEARVISIDNKLSTTNSLLNSIKSLLTTIDASLDVIEARSISIDSKLTTTNSLLTTIDNSLDVIESETISIDNKLDTSNGLLDNIKGVLDAIELHMFNVVTNTGWLDDIEKVLRESIYLKAFKDLKDINKVRYTYPGATTTYVPGYKTGGMVEGPGTSTSDSIPARLSKGEFVLTADTVSNLGPEFLNTLNTTGNLATALASFGIRGDNQIAHINDKEASLLKSLGGSGTKNTNTGLKQYFFDGAPQMPSNEAQTTLQNSKDDYASIFNKPDGWPQWLYTNNASSYTAAYDASIIGRAVSALIRTSSYAKNKGLSYVHKNWHRIGDYYYGSISTRPNNYSEFGYDWNSWNNSINATAWMGNPTSLQGTYGPTSWPTLASKIWNTWGVNSSTITPQGKQLASMFSIPGFKNGGLISAPGSGASDSMLARISDGEYIVRNSSVDNVGVDTLDYINTNGALPTGDTNIEVNIINKGQPVETETQPEVKIVNGKMVVDVVLKDLRTNGPIKRSIKKIK